MNGDAEYLVGCDIGGTTFSSSLFDENLTKVGGSKRELISSQDSANEFFDSIKNQILNLLKDIDKNHVLGVGVSCPGPLNSESGVVFDTPNLEQIQNINVRKN